MAFILVYVTHSSLKEAKLLCTKLLEEHLVACVNYFPINSSYWWNGKIESSREIVSLLKTSQKNWSKLLTRIKKLHNYKTPCILKLPVTANTDYERWIKKESKSI